MPSLDRTPNTPVLRHHPTLALLMQPAAGHRADCLAADRPLERAGKSPGGRRTPPPALADLATSPPTPQGRQDR